MNSYDVIIFHFMNTHPPIKNIQSVTILWMVHGVGGDGVVEGFMGWVGGCVAVWVVVGWVVRGFMGWVHILTHP